MNNSTTEEEILELEQYFINTLLPNLNVDLNTSGKLGYHRPMLEEAKIRLRKLRGTPIYIYDIITNNLIFISDSKQWLYNNISIHHTKLNQCLDLYLNRFFFLLKL